MCAHGYLACVLMVTFQAQVNIPQEFGRGRGNFITILGDFREDLFQNRVYPPNLSTFSSKQRENTKKILNKSENLTILGKKNSNICQVVREDLLTFLLNIHL